VDAYLRLAEHVPGERFTGEAFNFGTETPLSVIDVAHRILKVMGKEDLRLTILSQATNEIPRQFLDCTKARTLMNWKPRHDLDESLSITADWYRQRHQ
jgi:nucleoside-diphosphate-sugar epimerase